MVVAVAAALAFFAEFIGVAAVAADSAVHAHRCTFRAGVAVFTLRILFTTCTGALAVRTGSAAVALTAKATALAEHARVAVITQPAFITDQLTLVAAFTFRTLITCFALDTGALTIRAGGMLITVTAASAGEAKFIFCTAVHTDSAVRANNRTVGAASAFLTLRILFTFAAGHLAVGAGGAAVAFTAKTAALAEYAGITGLAGQASLTQTLAVHAALTFGTLIFCFALDAGALTIRAGGMFVAVAAAVAGEAEFIFRTAFNADSAVRAKRGAVGTFDAVRTLCGLAAFGTGFPTAGAGSAAIAIAAGVAAIAENTRVAVFAGQAAFAQSGTVRAALTFGTLVFGFAFDTGALTIRAGGMFVTVTAKPAGKAEFVRCTAVFTDAAFRAQDGTICTGVAVRAARHTGTFVAHLLAIGAGSAAVAFTAKTTALTEDSRIAAAAHQAVFANRGAVFAKFTFDALIFVFTLEAGHLAATAGGMFITVAAKVAVQTKLVRGTTVDADPALRAKSGTLCTQIAVRALWNGIAHTAGFPAAGAGGIAVAAAAKVAAQAKLPGITAHTHAAVGAQIGTVCTGVTIRALRHVQAQGACTVAGWAGSASVAGCAGVAVFAPAIGFTITADITAVFASYAVVAAAGGAAGAVLGAKAAVRADFLMTAAAAFVAVVFIFTIDTDTAVHTGDVRIRVKNSADGAFHAFAEFRMHCMYRQKGKDHTECCQHCADFSQVELLHHSFFLSVDFSFALEHIIRAYTPY